MISALAMLVLGLRTLRKGTGHISSLKDTGFGRIDQNELALYNGLLSLLWRGAIHSRPF
jgi:hypothetical protein